MKKMIGPNPLTEESHGNRPVRSFVLREGRLTRGQQRAIERSWTRFGVENDTRPIDFERVFQRQAMTHIEIGFGMGEALAWSAAKAPEQDFLGIEVHRPGVGSLLRQIEELELRNVRIVCADAVEVLSSRIGANSLASLRLYFPDPWPKKKHHKRRIVQATFVEHVANALQREGIFHLATDWQPYADHMMAVVGANRQLQNIAGAGEYSVRPDWRRQTKFEARGQRLGHGVWDLLFRKTVESSAT